MRRLLSAVIVASAACALPALAKDAKSTAAKSASTPQTTTATPAFVLNTEDYPPYQTKVNGVIDGTNVKIVRELFKRANVGIDIVMSSWETAFTAARDKPGQGVFTTARTPDREAQFQWVGPIAVTKWVLLAKKSRGLKVDDLEDALKYKIGGVTDDAKIAVLEKAGAKVDKIDDDAKNAQRLDKGEIDLWATGHVSGPQHAAAAGVTDIEELFVYREDFGYIALNKSVSPDTVATLNKLLADMRAKGELDLTPSPGALEAH
jgi:polar amino acid transport system substrate-binding protein